MAVAETSMRISGGCPVFIVRSASSRETNLPHKVMCTRKLQIVRGISSCEGEKEKNLLHLSGQSLLTADKSKMSRQTT